MPLAIKINLLNGFFFCSTCKNKKEAVNAKNILGLPIVLKADGLAAGKGVIICNSVKEAIKNTREILNGKFRSSNKVVLEQYGASYIFQ